MSFDRVLPRPPALYDEPAGRIHRQTSNLLEHKIMHNDHHALPPVTTAVTDRIHTLPIGRSNNSYRHPAEPENCSTALSRMQLSSLNREKAAQNQIPVRILTATKQVAALADEDSPQDRSASSSPTKPGSAKESATQFCLCQPDPKIPRPRNGTCNRIISPGHFILRDLLQIAISCNSRHGSRCFGACVHILFLASVLVD
jgi:HMG box factor